MADDAKDYKLGEFPDSVKERAELLADVTIADIAHRYRMQNVLGSGAQATVYQAVAKKTNRKVAVKVRAAQQHHLCPLTPCHSHRMAMRC